MSANEDLDRLRAKAKTSTHAEIEQKREAAQHRISYESAAKKENIEKLLEEGERYYKEHVQKDIPPESAKKDDRFAGYTFDSRNRLDNPTHRAAVEDKIIGSLDIGELVVIGYASQLVPIIMSGDQPRMWIRLRSTRGHDISVANAVFAELCNELALEPRLAAEMYTQCFASCQLLGLSSTADPGDVKPAPPSNQYVNFEDSGDYQKFLKNEKKRVRETARHLLRLAPQITEYIMLNIAWLGHRVNSLWTDGGMSEEVKGG